MVTLGAFAGDSLSFGLGRWVGVERAVRWGNRFGVTRERFGRAEKFYTEHGGKAVFIGRFASVFRPVIPFVAGTSRMSYRRFALFNLPAGLVWAGVFIALGYWAGDQWQDVSRWVDRAGWVFVITVILFVVAKFLKNRHT